MHMKKVGLGVCVGVLFLAPSGPYPTPKLYTIRPGYRCEAYVYLLDKRKATSYVFMPINCLLFFKNIIATRFL